LTLRDLTGCVLMGLAAALGSKFWHDLAYGLVDLRQKARAATNQAVAATASLVPPAPSGGGEPDRPLSRPSVAAPAPAVVVVQPP